jgi:hypothetical protein
MAGGTDLGLEEVRRLLQAASGEAGQDVQLSGVRSPPFMSIPPRRFDDQVLYHGCVRNMTHRRHALIWCMKTRRIRYLVPKRAA